MQRTDIAKLREEAYKEEMLGNLGAFYRDTAKTYEQRMLEETKRLTNLQKTWEDRFVAAEEAFRSTSNKTGLQMFMDPITGRSQRLFAVLDPAGNRRSFQDILKEDTSARGNIFDLGQSAKEIVDVSSKLSSYEQQFTSYTGKYNQEQALLAERNAKAKEKFLAEKQKKLEELSASAYKQATYIEKPI